MLILLLVLAIACTVLGFLGGLAGSKTVSPLKAVITGALAIVCSVVLLFTDIPADALNMETMPQNGGFLMLLAVADYACWSMAFMMFSFASAKFRFHGS